MTGEFVYCADVLNPTPGFATHAVLSAWWNEPVDHLGLQDRLIYELLSVQLASHKHCQIVCFVSVALFVLFDATILLSIWYA